MTNERYITQEISSYEHMLQVSETLKAKVKESQADLEASYTGMILAKNEFEVIKKQNIEELRLYKQAVQRECNEITSAIKGLKVATTGLSATELASLVQSFSTLAELAKSGFFDRFTVK